MYLLILAALVISVYCPAQTITPPQDSREVANTSGVKGQPSAGNATPANVSELSIRELLYQGSTTAIFARWMPWFGDDHHLDVGYRSDDPAQLDHHVEDMRSRGIDGVVVDWYGPSQDFKNRATQRLLASAERHGNFRVAISVDSGILKDCRGACDPTQVLIDDLSYLMKNFARSPAYARFNNRPLITFFGMEKQNIDWRRVRGRGQDDPLFVFRNSGAFQLPESDGGFAWVAPETVSPNDPSAFRYLDRFYETASRSPAKFAMGSVYKGFDDRLASWGKGRRIDQRCGETWLDTFAELNRHYSIKRQLPAVIIVTWNDYEEGTEIETGIDNCVRMNLRIEGERLTWRLDGPRTTIHHFEILDSKDGRDFVQLKEVSEDQSSFDLRFVRLAPGVHHLYLKAVGMPSIQNHIAGPITYTSNPEK